MRSENTFGVTFFPRLNKNKRKDYSIVAKISCNDSLPKELTIKGTFDIANWDDGKGCPKGTTKELRELATHLTKVKAKLTSIFQDLELNEEILSAENIKAHYVGNAPGVQRVTMRELAQKAYDAAKIELKKGSYKNYHATQTYIDNFCIHAYAGHDIPLRKVDFNFIDEFYLYILTHPIKQNDPLNKNGAAKHIERLKKMVKWAGEKGWCEKHVFDGFSAKTVRPETQYLTWEQLEKVRNVKIVNPLTELVRDLFVFCCFTGMAPIDVQCLTPGQLSTDINGDIWMTYTRVKSTVPAWVPLLEQAIELLKKRGLESGATYRSTVFPYVSNKLINDHLKIIGMLCGFDVELHAYMARHAFGTTVTMQMGVPAEVVQIMMGHEKLETTMIYARVGNPLVKMYMKRVQHLINSGENIGMQGIGETQFAELLEKVAPHILQKIFNEILLPKLTEIVPT